MRSIGMDCMILFGRAPTAEKVMQTRSHSGFAESFPPVGAVICLTKKL